MVMTKYELQDLVEELETYRGRHTELISVYVPSGFSLIQVAKQIDAEKGTAANIKSKTTRKNVTDALERIARQLRLIERTPANGLVVFCGNVASSEGQSDLKIWSIEPIKLLKIRLYRCDQTFVLEPLKEMLETEEVYGLLVVDRKEATIGLLEGKSIKVLSHMTSGVPSKIKAGGQSSQRFHRITEGLARDFFRRIAGNMKDLLFENKKLKGILIGGPVPTKEEFLETGQLVTALKEKVIGMIDIGNTDASGLKEMVDKAQDILFEQEITLQKKLLDEFFAMLAKEPEKVSYGVAEVEQRLGMGAVAKLILSRELDKTKANELKKLAQGSSTEVHIVTTETSEGVQFHNLGGVGAILRFAIHD